MPKEINKKMRFNNSDEAVIFGRNTTLLEIYKLKETKKAYLEASITLKNKGSLDAAMAIAVQAQFCKEALDAAGMTNNV